MALTPSAMIKLGTVAPDFSLLSTTGDRVNLSDFASHRALLIAFWCNHCPYVHHIRKEFIQFSNEWMPKGLAVAAINSNDANRYPADSPAKMKDEAEAHRYPFPYLHDSSQSVARAYDAACTPDLFLFDANHKLVYRGRFCPSTPGNGIAVTGSDLIAAVQAIWNNQPVADNQLPSFGCSIKWK